MANTNQLSVLSNDRGVNVQLECNLMETGLGPTRIFTMSENGNFP